MNNQGGWGSMTDRIAATSDGGEQPPVVKHCWVTTSAGRLRGLLLEWRQAAAGWEGRVVHLVSTVDGWIVVAEWLPAGMLEPA